MHGMPHRMRDKFEPKRKKKFENERKHFNSTQMKLSPKNKVSRTETVALIVLR
jgi:hypothetical protein